MSEDATNHESRIANHTVEQEETSFLDFLIVLAKHKKIVLGLPAVAAVIAAIVSLMLPNIYTATTKILPPQQSQSNAVAFLGQLGVLGGGLTQSALGLKNPSDVFVAMLKSRTLADTLIERFELVKSYDKSTVTDTRRELARMTRVVAGRDGVVTVEVDDRDPKRSAAIANAYIEELEKLTLSVAVTEASQRRLFFEKQLKQTRDQLAAAEISLRQAIDSKGLAGIDVQSRAILEPSAQLRAQIALREVQLGAIRIFATDQHPDIERFRHEIASMKRELAKLEGGDGELKLPATNSAGLENLRRFRDMKFLERLTELLTQQFEAAKIDEAKSATLVQVLDRAVEPEQKSRPARTLMVLGFGFIAIFLAVVWVYVAEAYQRTQADPSKKTRLMVLRQYLRKPWRDAIR
jgi:uncharacterized protein involved in exopolysaccharide biosynthesis